MYSLATAWVLVLLRVPLGPWFLPLALLRSGASGLQLAWNVVLGREQPLDSHVRSDWVLLAGALLLAQAYALAAHVGSGPEMTAVGAAMLVPYSLLQLRVAERSRRRAWVTRAQRQLARRPRARQPLWLCERPPVSLLGGAAPAATRAA